MTHQDRFGERWKFAKDRYLNCDHTRRWPGNGAARRGGGALKEKIVEQRWRAEGLNAGGRRTGSPVRAARSHKNAGAAKAGKAVPERSAEGGLIALTFSDYAKAGDKLSLGFDPQ